MTTEQLALLDLVKVGVAGNCHFGEDVFNADWKKIFELACKQGVACVAWRGIETLYKKVPSSKFQDSGLDTQLKLQWYARSQQGEKAAKKHVEKAAAFAEAVAPLRLAVLKGIDYAQYWPNPLWREFGDLDCKLVDKDSHELDKKCRELGYDVDDHDYKHTEIRCNGIMVENHHFFTCFGGSKSARVLEEELRGLFEVTSYKFQVSGLLSPSANFTAVFIVAHAQNHFFYEGMSLRQILDWHFFLTKEGGNVDWEAVNGVLERTRLMPFAVLLTQICKKHFGLCFDRFGTNSSLDDELVEKSLDDVFSDGYNSERKLLPMIGRLWHRFVRTVRFNELNKMSVATSVWRWLAFTSYLNRRPELK